MLNCICHLNWYNYRPKLSNKIERDRMKISNLFHVHTLNKSNHNFCSIITALLPLVNVLSYTA